MNTHRGVLEIPELLSIIFGYAPNRKSTAKNMQVCKLWAAVGKPFVWQSLDSIGDLNTLLRILAPWDFRKSPFTLPQSSLDWPRFLGCSRLVHHLAVRESTYGTDCLQSVLQLIFGTYSSATVFPNLQKLYCSVGRQLLHQSMNFLHPGVVDWRVEYLDGFSQFQISVPVQELSGLVSLQIGNVWLRRGLPGLSVLHMLPCLVTLVLSPYTVSYSVLEVLSRFPALETIQTGGGYMVLGCLRDHPPPFPFKDGSFRKLTVLTISGCPHQISDILDNKNFPSSIECLTIEAVKCDSRSPVYPTIVAKPRTVKKFKLNERLRDVPSPFASLKPFFSYNLTELRVKSLKLAYNALEIEELAHSLPMIEVLDFNLQPWNESPCYGTFTFNHLPLFARHCPKLTYLGILLDTSCPCETLQDDTIPFSVLEELDLGSSFVNESLSAGAAPLLALLLPKACQLTFTPLEEEFLPFHSALCEFIKDFVRNRPEETVVDLLKNRICKIISKF